MTFTVIRVAGELTRPVQTIEAKGRHEAELASARADFAQSLLQHVKDRDYKYVIGTYFQNRTLAEIAADHGDSRTRAGQLRQRGIADIRKHLQSQDADPADWEGLELPALTA